MAQRVNIEVLNKAAVDVQVQNSNAINVEVPTAPRDFVPRFTADKTEVEQLNSVNFSASEAGFEYYWEIQDTGGFIFKSGKNVSHQYDNIGEFDVALTQADLSKQKSGIQVKRNFIKVVEPDALLDKPFAIGATAAYSLRKLKSSATKAVRVREDSGNTETDIGFSGTLLDETALLNHVGSNNGFVTKWYDQSGNGNDASQSTASNQPKIVSSGTVIKKNGKPAIQSDGTDDSLPINSNLSDSNSNYSLFAVRNANSNGYLLDSGNGRVIFAGGNERGFYFDGLWRGSSFPADGNQKLTSFLLKNNAEVYINGSLDSGNLSYTQTSLKTPVSLISFNNGTGSSFSGKVQEVILYPEDKSSDRTKLESNINNHYSIF